MDGESAALTRMYEDRIHWLRVELENVYALMEVKDGDIERFRRENTELRRENARLAQQVKELTGKSSATEPEPPLFVKPNVPEKVRRQPGRPKGHQPALRPRPRKIDVHQEVSLPVDRRRRRKKTGQVRFRRHVVTGWISLAQSLMPHCRLSHFSLSPPMRNTSCVLS